MRRSIAFLLTSAAATALAACGEPVGETETTEAAAPETATAPAEPALIPREELFGNPTYASVQISPDGSMISWLAPLDGVLNIFVAPADDLDAARAVTSDTGRGILGYGWAPAENRLLYIQDRGGDENFLLYGVDPATGEEQDYTPFENTRALIYGGDNSRPGVMMIGLNNRDPRWHDAYELNLETGELTLVYENTDNFSGFEFDNDLELRIASRSRADGGADYFKRVDGEWVDFFSYGQEDSLTVSLRGFNAANDAVFITDSRDRDTAALFEMSVETGEKTLLAEDARADIGGVWVDPETEEPQAYAVTYARTEIQPLNEEGEAIIAALDAQFDGDFSLASRTMDDQHWIVLETASDQVATYHLWDREGDSFTELFPVRPELADDTLAKMHPVEITSRDGLTLVSYLTLPPASDADGDGRPEEPVPMVLWVHGGPWARDGYGYDTYAQWYANRGYAVLQVNFRGSTGFGKAFVNAGDLEWGEAMHDDLIDAVDWAVAEGVTNADSVAIGGGSYGGYATLAGLTFTPETFACGVDIVGPSNLITLLESIPPYWEAARSQFATRMGDPSTDEGRALLEARSPINRVDNIQRPLLIAQGANDPRVVQAESDQIVDAMVERDIPVTYVLFPDEGHGFARPENRLAFSAVAEGFLGACLGGRVEPIGDDFDGSSLNVPAGADYVDGLAGALEGFTPEERG